MTSAENSSCLRLLAHHVCQQGFQQGHVNKIIEQLETYREEYPLADLLNNNPCITERCDALIDYFEEIKSVLDEQEQSRIREMPVSDESESRYEEHLNSQLESSDFRTAIETVGDITQVDALEEEANVTFSGETSFSRQLFVDDERETIFQSPHHDFIDQYRRLVLGEMDFQEREIDSAADIPDALAELISEKEVRLIICEHMDVGRILQDDERSERSSNDIHGSHFSFLGVPVLRDVTTEFATVAFFDEDFEYVEKARDVPASVKVTAGENVDDWDASELPADQDIRDHVRIELSYNAYIETAGQNGVIFRISD